jgi:predicted HD phosphohydrolase
MQRKILSAVSAYLGEVADAIMRREITAEEGYMADIPSSGYKARYTRMEDGTREEYLTLRELSKPFLASTPDRLLSYMPHLRNSYPGEQVDRYEHSLQTASRAFRDEAEEEIVVAALLHDIGDLLAPENHSDFAAAILRPFVSETTHWIVLHHGIFQGYFYFHHYSLDRNERDRFRGHPAFEQTSLFCERYDQAAFDPSYDTMPIKAFEPLVRRVFARTPWSTQ